MTHFRWSILRFSGDYLAMIVGNRRGRSAVVQIDVFCSSVLPELSMGQCVSHWTDFHIPYFGYLLHYIYVSILVKSRQK